MSRSTVRCAAASLIILTLTAGACVRPPVTLRPAAGRTVLAVVSWNTHAGTGDLPQLIDDLSSGRLTGEPIRQFVLLLQEATANGEHGVDRIARERALATFFSPVRVMNRQSAGNAIVSTRPLRDARRIDLPQERQPRAAVAATIEIDGHELFVVSAHLENRISWWRGGLFSDNARGRQATALLRALPETSHGIVGGDFNTWLGVNEPAWRSLLRRFDDTPPERPQPTFRDRLVLDHLFFDVPDEWRAQRRVIGERYGSDHHPVLGLITEGP